MKLPAFTDDHLHVIFGGESGAGKTHTANWVHAYTSERISIFFNSAHVDYINGKKVRTVRELGNKIAEGYRKFNFFPPIGVDEEQIYEELTYFLFRLGQKGHKLQLITDEIHEFAGHKESAASLQWRKGRNYNIKNIGLTQEYRTVSHSVLTQSKWHVWVGQPNMMESQYFEKYNLPYEQLKQSGDNEYHVMRGGSMVESGVAPADY